CARVLLGKRVRARNRRRAEQRQRVGEQRTFGPAASEHVLVEAVDDVELLAEQQRAVATRDERAIAVAPGFDLAPRVERRGIDDAGAVELLDARHAAAEIRLVHRRLVLEDLLLHPEKRRLVEVEIAGRLSSQLAAGP